MGIDLSKKRSKASLFSATLLSATCMVGSGWLFSAQLSARAAGNWSFLAYFLSAVIVAAVGMCLSKVVGVYPVRGATARSSSLSHNSLFGMPFAFANWFGIMVTVATEAQATTQYLSAAIGSDYLMQNSSLTYAGKSLALMILFLYLMINYYGIKVLARVNNVVSVLKIFTPIFTILVLIIAAFHEGTGGTQNFYLTTNSEFTPSDAIGAIIGAGLIYSFNGFQTSVAYASEIENPKRNVPISIITSIGIVLVLYLGLQYAFMASVPHEILLMKGGWSGMNFSSPLLNLSMLLGLNFLAILLLADSVISPSGTGYAYLGASSRMLYGMAKEKQVPGFIAKLDPIYNFSKRSMLINFFLVAIVLWNAKNWSCLMIVVTGYHTIGYMAAPVSMGGIFPKYRPFGIVVFIILGLVMNTISSSHLLAMNLSLTTVMVIYSSIQNRIGISLSKILYFNCPFLLYLWIIYLVDNVWITVIISAIVYVSLTNKRYVSFCRTSIARNDTELDEQRNTVKESN